MSLGGTGIGKAFNFINDPLGILPSDVSRILFDPAGIFSEPDTISTDTPDPEKALMSADIGGPIADACGTAKITGQLLAFGDERNEITYSEAQSGGKGAPEQPRQATGRKYYMTWQVGILACPDNPVDTLYSIFKNDDVEAVWSGELDNPVSGGKETIVIEGIGSVDFYFGTDDQVANSSVGEIIKDSTLNSPLRYHCWAVFVDCYIGETNRVPTYKFVLQKTPVVPELTSDGTILKYRVNPAHAMWYILHTLAGLPITWLNTAAFKILENTMLIEARGMCVQFNRQQTALNFLENINGHIDNILLYNTDGQFHPKLIRDDYTFANLPVVTESDMLSDPNISSVSFIDTINEIKIQYPELINEDAVDPDPTPMPIGEMITALSKRSDPQIYTYLVSTGAIVKIDTDPTAPIVTDYLVVNDDTTNYTLENSGNRDSMRGAYAISKDSQDKIWYLFKDDSNGNIKLVEIDVSTYPMRIIKTSVHTAILDYGANETLTDACADDDYAFFTTTKVAGRILKFDTSHTLTDENLGYPTAAADEAIASITLNPTLNQIFWIRNNNTGPACLMTITDYSFNIITSFAEVDAGADSARWQNFIRYNEISDYHFRQRIFEPTNGVAYYYSQWAWGIGRQFVQGLKYMKSYLGGGALYFYVLNDNSAGNDPELHRFTVGDSTAGGAVPETSIDVSAYVYAFSAVSYNSVYNDDSDKTCLLRYNSSDGWNRIATFNSSLSNISDPTLDTIYWGQ